MPAVHLLVHLLPRIGSFTRKPKIILTVIAKYLLLTLGSFMICLLQIRLVGAL
jgi:hypothetical protein